MSEGFRAALLPTIRKAIWQFQRDQYDRPTELYMGYGLWLDLRQDNEFARMIQWGSPNGPIRIYGLTVGFREGPLTLIARLSDGRSIRWRMGYGYDAAFVRDERAAIYRNKDSAQQEEKK